MKKIYVDCNANRFRFFPLIRNPYYQGNGSKKKPFLTPDEATDWLGAEGGSINLAWGDYTIDRINIIKNNTSVIGAGSTRVVKVIPDIRNWSLIAQLNLWKGLYK